jgi:hydroxymethylpyrimidine/phosphomethylpyrimidine kinase
MTRPCVLSIAGSDSGGGAGIQADLRTFAAFGVHGASAITAVTAQNSRGVARIFELPDDIISAQIDSVMSELKPGVVKVGMLANRRIVELVAAKLAEWQPLAVVLDPVMVSSSGGVLLEEDGVEALRALLVPMATLVTPNWDEIPPIINAWPRGMEDIQRVAISFQRLGARSVLIKGGHIEGSEVVDTLFDGRSYHQYSHPRIAGARGHGTGCALASAIAAGLALGRPLSDACRDAVDFVQEALHHRYAVGSSDDVYLPLSARET